MRRRALIMAGGAGTRMRDSGVKTPKALVPVAGRALIEWNVRMLLHHEFDEIYIVIPRGAKALSDFCEYTLAGLVGSANRQLSLIEEAEPLGNMGAIRLVERASAPLMVVYADNLTALDLGAVWRYHDLHGAAMTIAVHGEPFRMPFGEVLIENGQVVDYREKPVIEMTVCSAVSVLSRAAVEAVAESEAIGISELVLRLIAQGRHVAPFRHQAPWIDVNDQVQAARAEALVAAHFEAFGLPQFVCAP